MKYLLRRILISIIMIFATSILIFVVLRALPGDPVIARLGTAPGITQETLNRLRSEAGLDQPLLFQYISWILGLFRGDLGESYFSKTSVSSIIIERLPPTLELTVFSVMVSAAIAFFAAAITARKPGGFLDRVVTTLFSIGMAFPPFIGGIGLLIIFSVTFRLLPARGFVAFFENPAENLTYMILPTTALSIVAAPLIFRHLRGGTIEALKSDFARTATGKGASSWRVVWRHALPNSALPSLTMIGLVFGYTLGGSVIIEYMFGISGLGSLSVESAFRRDYAVLQSVVVLVSALFITVSLLIDLIQWRLDPRLRESHA